MNRSCNFFDMENYFVEENVIPFKSYNAYQIFNDKRENIGLIKQRFTKTEKVLKTIFGNNIPVLFEIRSANGMLEASISRGWIFLKSKIIIRDSKGNKVGSIAHNLFKATYKIMDASNIAIAEISGNRKEWSYEVSDASGNQKGSLGKKWTGNSTDKYNVNIENNFKNKEEKIAILASAITFGMVK